MKEIPLTQGKVALVDDADYEWLNKFRWCVLNNRNTSYALRRHSQSNGKQKNILMHRLILGLNSGDGKDSHHIDGDGLNNQRSNLRICSHFQNLRNAKSHKQSSSIFKGVSWSPQHGKWYAKIGYNWKQKNLGYFKNEIDAAKVYDKAAIQFHGEFARLNFPKSCLKSGI